VRWRRGALDEPEIRRGKVRQAAFDLDAVALSKLGNMIADAIARSALEQPEASHVIVDRQGSEVIVRVYVHGLRDSELVRYDADGAFVR